jgi:hypothetical protein
MGGWVKMMSESAQTLSSPTKQLPTHPYPQEDYPTTSTLTFAVFIAKQNFPFS